MDKVGMGVVAKVVAGETGLSEAMVQLVLKTALWQIMEQLAEGKRVTLTGFGSFAPKIVAPRRIRNPQTGEVRIIDARGKVHFIAGKMMREVVESALSRALSKRVSDDGDALIVVLDEDDEAGPEEVALLVDGPLPRRVQAKGSTALTGP